MRFLRYGLMVLAVSLVLGLPVMAQEDTPPITVDEVQAILAEAQKAQDDADRAVDMAFNLLGLFEYMAGAVAMILGVVVPFVALVAGLFGFSRLASAQSELREARVKFEEDVAKRQTEMSKYFDEIRENAELERVAFQNERQAFETERIALQEAINAQKKQSADANLALALMPLAERQYLAQDYTGAIDTYHRALALDPNNPLIHYQLGYVNTQSGKLEEAKGFLEKALEIDPEFYQALAALGYVYRRVGDAIKDKNLNLERDTVYNQSEQYFLRALSKLPRLVDEDKESWWGALGGLYRRRGQIEQAIEAYKRASEVTPHSSYPFSNLALLYLQRGEREKMVETYKRVERLAKSEVNAEVDNYWAYADWVVSLLAQGKFQEVDEIIDVALSVAPIDSPYTLDMLLDTLTRVGNLLTEYRPKIDTLCAYIQAFIDKRNASQTDTTT